MRITEPVEAKPDLGLDYLEYLVGRAATRDSILPLVQGPLKQLHKALGARRVSANCTASTLEWICSKFPKVALAFYS